MGVPRLYPWVLKMFGKEAARHFQEGEYSLLVDNLYDDANALLHGTAQYVYNYGQNKSLTDDFAHLSPNERRLRCFEMFFDLIKFLSTIVVPQKRMYIAIDGPAPLAKQAQQRQRRFAAAQERTRAKDKGVGGFDSNQLTPGTPFMFELTKFMHTAIRKELNNPLSQWFGLEVYFSPATVPGEGEHKLLDEIRANPKAHEESHCIFGPDGDLIMLTLAAHVPKIYLFREDQYNPGFYDILDMGLIRRKLVEGMQQGPGFTSRKRNLNDISNDFIITGFFVGNDFLPKIQMFMYLEDGLELMIKTYAGISGGGTRNVLSKDGVIQHAGFTRFVEELARREHSYILDQATPKADRQGKFLEPKFDNHTLLKHVHEAAIRPVRNDAGITMNFNNQSGSVIHKQGLFVNGANAVSGKKTLDMASYRIDYYAKAGIDATGDDGEAAVRKICLDYLRAIAWVFDYYIERLPSWRDFYAWHYAPLMTDLAFIMKDASAEELKFIYNFKMDTAPRPFVQLLSVLPPASANLLPGPFRSLLTSEKSPLVELGYYPDSFDVDLEGKTKEHMGVVLLPFVDVDEIEKAYQPIFDGLQLRYARNDVTTPEVFVYDAGYTAKYTSDYGNIPKLHVRKITRRM